MSHEQSWTTIDKSQYHRTGQWNKEPDKVQWVDDVTGLDCLIVRNNGGALCGYVGVPESHPFYGKDYAGCTQDPACESSHYCEHAPSSRLNVHGGITFASGCQEPTREKWESWREAMLKSKTEIREYPNGDSARRWKLYGKYVTDFDGWKAWGISSFICHLPLPGQPDKVWWFGFDCAHSGDLCPVYDQHFGMETYKGIDYVKAEVYRLAGQLKEVV